MFRNRSKYNTHLPDPLVGAEGLVDKEKRQGWEWTVKVDGSWWQAISLKPHNLKVGDRIRVLYRKPKTLQLVIEPMGNSM
jgi:membrane protein implicated in regulation of membrane protease activity